MHVNNYNARHQLETIALRCIHVCMHQLVLVAGLVLDPALNLPWGSSGASSGSGPEPALG